MELDEVKAETTRLSNWAHIATVGADGNPDVVPVWPAWPGDTLWIFTGTNSVKVGNIAANPNVALHWQVDESGDGVELWGTATVATDWTPSAGCGPVCSPTTSTTSRSAASSRPITASSPSGRSVPWCSSSPERALVLKQYGMAGRDTWQRP
ncbi:MAG: pyridoxamine 5'-phosphate oxidase family protein [Acidimicrobiales bacterium]